MDRAFTTKRREQHSRTRGDENVNGENPRYARKKKKLKREKKAVELVL